MGLDTRGDISIVEIIFYIPILATSLIITLRHGFSRRAGWIFLLILAIIRIVGSAIHLASENNQSNTTLRITYSVLEAAGLSPLIVATLGFLNTIALHAFDGDRAVTLILRLLGTTSIVALALVIAGGIKLANADNDISKLNSASTLRHVGAILFLVLFIFLALLHLYYWAQRDRIMEHRRKLLIGISLALPFLGVRVIYAVLSSYAPVDPNDTNGSLAKFSTSTGAWAIYLGMAVIMEFIVVLIYTFCGITIPMLNDHKQGSTTNDYMENGSYDWSEPMSRRNQV
ncbi:unnamed protein product [Somion occarium]|uniref:DUF7702 domain-containing protein n=1 Tax=Somion occarium TaxID=3059160 RepID=A0ABP1D3T9_9APHY